MYLYKILTPWQWREFEDAGRFDGSPVDKADGFVHTSTRAQVTATARRHFAGEPRLVVVVLDGAALADSTRWEPARSGEEFPHVYGPLPRSAVRSVHRVTGADGVAALPPDPDAAPA